MPHVVVIGIHMYHTGIFPYQYIHNACIIDDCVFPDATLNFIISLRNETGFLPRPIYSSPVLSYRQHFNVTVTVSSLVYECAVVFSAVEASFLTQGLLY